MDNYFDYDSFMENFFKKEPENIYIDRSYEKVLYFSQVKILYSNDGKGYVFYTFNNKSQLLDFNDWCVFIKEFFRFSIKFVDRRSLMF